MKLTNGQVQSKKREAASLLRLETAAEGVGTTVFFVVGFINMHVNTSALSQVRKCLPYHLINLINGTNTIATITTSQF